jgi:hypothetical protein
LHRAGSDGELLTWAGLLDQGTPKYNLDLALLNTAEAQYIVINNIYQQLLQRPADLGGLQFWQGEMQAGFSPEQIMAFIAASDEYAALHGGTNAGYVLGLYNDLLGRGASPSDVGFWTSVLAGTNRTTVASMFLNTTEYRGRLVNSLFVSYLGHPAGPDVFNPDSYFQQLYQEGFGDVQIRAIILAAPAYFRAV